MEQARVVALVGRAKVLLHQAGVHVAAVDQRQEAAVRLHAAILAHAQEDDAVNGALHGLVELALCERGVAQRQVAGEGVAPALDLRQKGLVHGGSAALADGVLGVAVESAAQDGLVAEYGGDLVPTGEVLVVGEVDDARRRCAVAGGRLDAAVVDRELVEIGEDRERQLGRPGITSQLVGGAYVLGDVHGRLFGLHKELARPPDTEAIVGRLDALAHADGILVDDVFVGLGVAGAVVHVPTEGLEQRVDELVARLGLVVAAGPIGLAVAAKALHQFGDDLRRGSGHGGLLGARTQPTRGHDSARGGGRQGVGEQGSGWRGWGSAS